MSAQRPMPRLLQVGERLCLEDGSVWMVVGPVASPCALVLLEVSRAMAAPDLDTAHAAQGHPQTLVSPHSLLPREPAR